MVLLALLLVTGPLGIVAGYLASAAANGVTVISSLPYTVTSPGVYVLESDLSTSGDGIIVASPNVVIRGGGHRIMGVGHG